MTDNNGIHIWPKFFKEPPRLNLRFVHLYILQKSKYFQHYPAVMRGNWPDLVNNVLRQSLSVYRRYRICKTASARLFHFFLHITSSFVQITQIRYNPLIAEHANRQILLSFYRARLGVSPCFRLWAKLTGCWL